MADKPDEGAATSRVPIDPQAVINATSAENDWRKNRMLLLENELVRLRSRIRELEAAAEQKSVAKSKESK